MEQKLIVFCAHNAPPGLYWEREAKWVEAGVLGTAVLAILVFLVRCLTTVGNLYEYKWKLAENGAYQKVGYGLKDGAMMPAVSELLGGSRIGFALVGLLIVIFAVNHYRHYRQESMSIYLMKRLPNRWEYHRRNLTLPVMFMGAVLAAMVLTELICYGGYLALTPAGCLPAGQWEVFWMWMIGG
ncbi:MAG: hypothetical protein IJA58_00090, partial [Lachnospiraceae bacterium]|nr:hypothetical protein [Lachnospiraceae bacterium]